MIWNPAEESMPRERLAALQLERLREVLARQLAAVPPQAERLRGAGIGAAADVTSLDDLRRLPFTVKADLRDHYPWGLFAVPRDALVRVHASSGTRGKPTLVGYTATDMATWNEVMARCLTAHGVRRGMLVHNAYGYGLFTGGLGVHQAAEMLGCPVVPVSGGFTQRQITLLRDLRPDVLGATPSYALNLAQAMQDSGVAPRSLGLQVGVFGAEPWTDALRDELERQLGLRAMNLYGLSEIVGPGVSAECEEARDGLHVQEDHFLAEIVDPATGAPLPAGELGELVLTTLTKEALPLVRYRTGDVSALDPQPCVCGRTTARMARVRGRYDDMLIIRGVNVYPSEIERVLLGVPGVAPQYQLVVDRPAALDALTVRCEAANPTVDSAALGQRVQAALSAELGLHVLVDVADPGALPRSEGKAVRVIDRRQVATGR